MTSPVAGLSNEASSSATSRAAHPRAHAHVASKTPGRLRVRIHHPQRHQQLMRSIQRHLEAQPGTHGVRVDARTGSVLVHYDPHTQTHVGFLSILHDLGVIAGDTAHGLDMDAPELDGATHSKASENVITALSDLDRQIATLTGHQVDLKLLFPLALGGVGLFAAARRGLGLGDVPAYVLLWYAFDSFWKFHREPAQPN
jgi:hypothetical protein